MSRELYCIPHAGGVVAEFAPWSGKLGDWGVRGVVLPGRGRRFGEPLLTRVEDMALEVVRMVHGNAQVALFGHSLGALVAFEAARLLEQRGTPPAVVVVSGRPPPSAARSRPVPLHELDDGKLMREVAELGGTDAAILDDPELLEILVPRLRADLRAAATYRPPEDATIAAPILAVAGTDDDEADVESMHAWRRATRSWFAAEFLLGDHFYLREQQSTLLAILLGVLNRTSDLSPSASEREGRR